jgi:hypothetical protein
MTTQVEYALMAGASYISTRASVNKFPTPNNWTKITAPDFYSRDPYSGFEAISFTNGSEIVISYAAPTPATWLATLPQTSHWPRATCPTSCARLRTIR